MSLQRRKPMNKGNSQLERTPFKRSNKRIKPISDKRATANAQNRDWRQKVLEKDGYTCQLCKAARAGVFVTDMPHPELMWQMKQLNAHHVKGRTEKLLYNVEEAMCLCLWHHEYSRFSPHGGPAKWKILLEKIK